MNLVRFEPKKESAMSVSAMMAVSAEKAHKIMTHCGEADTRLTFSHLNIPMKRGPMNPCQACALAKAKKKNLPNDETGCKITNKKEKEVTPVFLDLSTLSFKIDGKTITLTNPNWRVLVDAYS